MIEDVNEIIFKDPRFKDYDFVSYGVGVDAHLDASDKEKLTDPYMLIEEYQINVRDLRHNPSITAFRNGWEILLNGYGSVEELYKVLPDFDKKARQRKNEEERRSL